MANKRKNESPLNTLPPMELLYLTRLYMAQRGKGGVSADLLPYTPQIEWIVGEMEKKFPNSTLWSDIEGRQRVYRSLMRIRKAGLADAPERKSKNQIVVPDFSPDLDTLDDNETIEVSADGKVAEPQDGQ